MYKKEVVKLNKENLFEGKRLIRLYIDGIGNATLYFVDNVYVEITTIPLTTQQLKEK